MNKTTKVILAVAMSVIILSMGFIGGFAAVQDVAGHRRPVADSVA